MVAKNIFVTSNLDIIAENIFVFLKFNLKDDTHCIQYDSLSSLELKSTDYLVVALTNSNVPDIIAENPHDNVIIIGDFNQPSIKYGLINKLPLDLNYLLIKVKEMLSNNTYQVKAAKNDLTFVLDYDFASMFTDDKLVNIKYTYTEGVIILQLIKNIGHDVSKESIANILWNSNSSCEKKLESHIYNIRKKLIMSNSGLKIKSDISYLRLVTY